MSLCPSVGLRHRPDFIPLEPGSHVAALPPRKKCGRNAACYDGAGLPVMVVYARLIAWAIEQHAFPEAPAVITRFRCSKATAHRWLNFLAEAYGVERPRLTQGRPR